ncbi:MAG: alpha-L-rhamnosidase N-terminal domain-containing protein [Deltaproteobacteria bacterium]|nr:alpha-L-rhamnosidase N-terminal domain-containing protein [Deltaproteobacteria bacterium]
MLKPFPEKHCCASFVILLHRRRKNNFGIANGGSLSDSPAHNFIAVVFASLTNDFDNSGDQWDSGKVTSDQSVNIAYEGSALTSSDKCYWKVRCWDKDDKASTYSKPATFEMGLLNQSDWEGKWIGADISISSPPLRKEFEITKKVKCARIYISGVGWYELFINGEKVGDHVLDPATTDYAKRILYALYDVTALLREGPNAIGVMLGNGWYSEPGFQRQYGDSPRLLLQMNIEFTDGSTIKIQTDETWKSSSGPITRNDLYGGETYDARLEKPGWSSVGYDDSDWDDV